MTTNPPSSVYQIKKYPNRRFYDSTRRRHATLADLYELVNAGNEIVVTDSKSGEDITNIVLTQIILEHDPPKLDLFPASLLHQAIHANPQVVRRFIDEYFAGAMEAFVASRGRFDEFLRRAGMGFVSPPDSADWARMMFGGKSPPSTPQTSTSAPPPVPTPTSTPAPPHDATAEAPVDEPKDHPTPRTNLDAVTDLRTELDALRTELADLRAPSHGSKPRSTAKKRPAKKKTGKGSASRKRTATPRGRKKQ